MKKLILLSFIISLFQVNAQNEYNVLNTDKNINVNVTNVDYGIKGINYVGGGTYKYVQRAEGFTGKKGLEKRGRELIAEMADNKNFDYKVLSVDAKTEMLDPIVTITWQFLNKEDGSIVVSKQEAKKELIDLKEYLDLGIITQEEFDKKVVSLKKILLGN